MQHVILGTAGHVDHGKTALIKALTNIDCDSHKEEKERGITINLGFAHINLPSGDSAGIVDVPGHKDFIKTMVAGAFGIDIVLLVVAADSGIMPQTREHLQILNMLDVTNGIVVITKKDLVDDEILELVQLEISELLEGSALESAALVQVSSTSGEGIEELVSEISKLIPQLQSKSSHKLFRMYIDRVFNVKGIGYVVTGSVLGGKLEAGSSLSLLPGSSKQFKVRSIERHGANVNTVESGDRAALNLSGFKMEDFQRGMVLTDELLEETSLLDATFKFFADEQMNLWTRTIFYSGTFECSARVHLLNVDTLKEGDVAIIQIHLDKPAILIQKDKYILRNSSNDKTLGGGVVIDINPLHHRRRTPKLIAALNELAEAALNSDQQFNIIKIELNKTKAPVFIEDLASFLKISKEVILSECNNNNDGSVKLFMVSNKTICVHFELQEEYKKLILSELEQYHKLNFLLEEGMDVNEFVGKLGLKSNEISKLFIAALLHVMETEGLIRKAGRTWAISEHSVKLDKNTSEQLSWLENSLLNYKRQTPLMKELEVAAYAKKISKENLRMLLKYLTANGKIIAAEGEYIHSKIVSKVKQELLPVLAEKERGMNEKDLRLLLDSTKNFVKTIIRILIGENIVTKSEFYVHITEKGKKIQSGL